MSLASCFHKRSMQLALASDRPMQLALASDRPSATGIRQPAVATGIDKWQGARQ